MSDANKAPSYPWYPRDFAADEPVQLMTLAEEGAYRRLLDHQWLNGSVPGEIEQLARICKNIPIREMRRIWPAIEPLFSKLPGKPARLQNGKLERVRLDRQEFIEKQREAGSRGGKEASRRRHDKVGEYSEPSSDPTSEPTPLATDPLVAKEYPAVCSMQSASAETTSVLTEPADAAPDLSPHNQQSVMRLIVDCLYFGHRPLDREMATNGSILRNWAAKYGFEYMARVIVGLGLRRDRGELHGVGTTETVSLKWLNSAKMDLNQLAVSEDAYYTPDKPGVVGRIGA